MRCLGKSKIWGRCVLDVHIGGRHINSQGSSWPGVRGLGSQKRRGKAYYCYLNSTDGKALQAEAAAHKMTPGALVKEWVLSHLAAIAEYEKERARASAD